MPKLFRKRRLFLERFRILGFSQFLFQEVRQANDGQEEGAVLFRHLFCRVTKVRGKLDESRTVLFLIASDERLIFGIDQGEDRAPSFVFKRSEETLEFLLVLCRQIYTPSCHHNPRLQTAMRNWPNG